ncbi:hypothetical protein FHX09_005703 [Rhizobium sp. BK538]|nr:hypothetical protein [Rhizobium sp. BK538]
MARLLLTAGPFRRLIAMLLMSGDDRLGKTGNFL